jgi:tetratricopeptide (TPR) repeat protein
MLMSEGNALRSDVAVFLEGSRAFESGLMVLSAAESLTDELAAYLVVIADLERPSNLINALHVCDFVVERNSEWNLAPAVREYLLERLSERPELFRAAHGRLLQVSQSPGLRSEFSEVPRYLVEGPGEAYHASALDPSEGLPKYTALALSGQRGQQWLGARLAREQQAFGILPPQSLEVDFLQGMVYYREGNIREAEPVLRRVSEVVADRMEVAIALHIIGRIDGRRGRTHQAETELKRSIEIGEQQGNQFHQAQVLHTLGQLIGRDRNRSGEAEEMLRQSLAILRTLGDAFGEAQVLHTLGQLIGRDRNRSGEAEEMLRQSLAIRPDRHDAFGEAQVLHTLGQLLGRDGNRSGEAEEMLRQSLAIGEQQRNNLHQAQVLYTLGKLLSRSNREESIRMLRRSLAINRQMHNSYGINLAQSELRHMKADPN